MRFRTSQWVFVGLVALALQACGQEPTVEQPRRTASIKKSSSNQNSGSRTVPTQTERTSGTVSNGPNSSIPTTQAPSTQQPTTTSPTPTPDSGTLDPSTANGRVLNMASVYNQSSTQFCWAYSTFHTLRTYYNNSTATDSATLAWREALKKLDSSSALMSFMKERYNTNRTGMPSWFLDLMIKEYNLPAVNADWEEFYVGAKLSLTFGSEAENLDYNSIPEVDYADYSVKTNRNVPFTQIMTKFQERIHKGLPSVYCDKGHCMSMYGYTKNSSGITYHIADSIGGRKYTETESKVKSRLYMMMTK